MNRIDLIGRLTRDPELRKTETGHVRADFTIAVNRIGAKEEQQQADFIPCRIAVNRIGAKEEQQQADFIPCRVWGSQAENLTHFMGKGNQIAIEGNLRIDSYIDKDGNTKYTTYVLANRIEYLTKGEKKEESKEEPTEDISNSFKMDEIEIDDSDLPF